MAETIDEISCTWEENGTVTVEELDKVILTRGAWVTILFKFREMTKSGEYSATKFTLRRYRKQKGVFRQQSKFNISSLAQARGIVDALSAWVDEAAEAGQSDDE